MNYTSIYAIATYAAGLLLLMQVVIVASGTDGRAYDVAICAAALILCGYIWHINEQRSKS